MIHLDDVISSTGAQLIQKGDHERFCGVSIDSRTAKKGEVFFAVKGERFDGHDFIRQAIAQGVGALVVSKDFCPQEESSSVSILKVADTVVALGKLAQQRRRNTAIPFIAVTGSNGKTTSKEIIAAVLSQKYRVLKNTGTFNNHIGLPMTLLGLRPDHEACVAELGTNHFGEITYLGGILEPDIGVITNIGLSHLEFFKNKAGVLKEKKSLVPFLKGPKILFLNRDDALLKKIKIAAGVNVFYFGIDEASDVRASDISLIRNRVCFTLNKKHRFRLNSVGRFNVYNGLAAIGCGLVLGVSIKKIRSALEDFIFPLQRLRCIECRGFSIFDDSYNSNPFSLQQAITSLSEYKAAGRRIVVMGDMLELGERSSVFHKKIGDFIARQPIDMLITFGEFSKACAQAAGNRNKQNRTVVTCDSKEEIVAFLKQYIKAGDALLIKGSRLLKMEEITASLKNHAL